MICWKPKYLKIKSRNYTKNFKNKILKDNRNLLGTSKLDLKKNV